jgi:hypothetical protein
MQRLFSQCTHLQDILESQGRLEEFGYSYEHVREFNLDISTEELLTAERAFTYADLYAILERGDTVAWFTPHASVVRAGGVAHDIWEQLGEGFQSYHLFFIVDGIPISAFADSLEHLLEICDVVLRLLAVSVVHSLRLIHCNSPYGAFINAPTLAYFMEQCQSLEVLSLHNLNMDERHCRVLGDNSRPGLEIVLGSCRITSAGAGTLAEVLGRNQGPTKLDLCKIDNVVLANGLRGNSRLKSLRLRFSLSPNDGNRELLAIASALKENKGLVNLNLSHDFTISDETWGVICVSLETHLTLEVLVSDHRFTATGDMFMDDDDAAPAPAVLKSQIQALVDLLKVNTSIHTIDVDSCYSNHELFRGSVIPYLENNRLRPRVLAIQKIRPIAYRAKVLGQALLAVRTDPNRIWMLLSGNPEVAFPSGTSVAAAVTNGQSDQESGSNAQAPNDAVVTNAPAENTSNGDGAGGGNARQPRDIPKLSNGNPRGEHGGWFRSRNKRSTPKSDQDNGQLNQESGSNAQAPNDVVVTNAPAENTSDGHGAGGGNVRKPSPSRRTATSEVDVVAGSSPK